MPCTGPPTPSRIGIHLPMASTVDNVISLSKRRGFVYQCGEIYGGTRSAWDYGPLGVELKENIKRQWWRSMVQSRDDVVGLDSSVILPDARSGRPPATSHAFVDPLVECQHCHKRFRAGPPAGGVRREEGHRRPRHRRRWTAIACPQLRHPRRVDRAADVQRPAQDLPRPGRGRGGPALPAARDGAGHLRQLRATS